MRKRILSLAIVALVCGTCCGCVGPNRLKRGLDRHLNQGYVDHPIRAQFLFPLTFIANHVAILGDLLILNPKHFWSDVFQGHGTPYVYEQVTVPDPNDTASENRE